MKTTLIIILCALLSISASVVTSNIVSQPARPIAVFTDWYSFSTSLVDDIKKYHKQGYVVKSITSNSNKSEYILVMEKY